MSQLVQLVLQAFSRITPRGKRIAILYCLGLIALSGLDGIALILLTRLLQGGVQTSIAYPEINGTAGSILLFVILLFILKSTLATLVSRVAMRAFGDEEVEVGKRNYFKLSKLSWEIKQNLNQSDYFSMIDRGPTTLVQGIVLTVATLIAELASGLLLLLVVFFMQPVTAISAFVYFVLVALLQHRILSVSVQRAGSELSRTISLTYELLADSHALAKLLEVMPSRSFEIELNRLRTKLARSRTNLQFLTALPRYFMESILALGFLVIGGVAYFVSGESSVGSSLVLFSAAGFRLLPSINRVQTLILSLFGSAAQAREALRIDLLTSEPENLKGSSSYTDESLGEPGIAVRIVDLCYKYPKSESFAISNISLDLRFGLQYAIVGRSGAGKTTLVDLILGLLEPTSGKILQNHSVNTLSRAYVPQDSFFAGTTLEGNVGLEWDGDFLDNDRVSDSLRRAQIFDLKKTRNSFEDTYESTLLEARINLSGGQRQRLGIARAFYRNPNFIVFDEATSSLDAQTEFEIMEAINELRLVATTVIVAHRLTTIQKVDQVIFVDNGNIVGIGTFNELRETFPEFAKQVELFTLTD
jgi:ABC-type multidrug transport system fused ATPase/permease subunit